MSGAMAVVCALLALLGLILALMGLLQRRRVQASAGWQSVEGQALKAEIRKKVVTTGTGRDRSTSSYYSPDVKYQYVVDGVRYEADRVAFGPVMKSSEEEVRQLMEQAMPSGAPRVFYDPRKPQNAVLLNTEQSGATGYLVAGAVVIAVAVVLAVFDLIR
ncbi:MAG: DUF3592 domain-containing protein [Chloroflexi bacterium]|nr:DUF3592 domain-containing protein [Chloroflexota bacterium]